MDNSAVRDIVEDSAGLEKPPRIAISFENNVLVY